MSWVWTHRAHCHVALMRRRRQTAEEEPLQYNRTKTFTSGGGGSRLLGWSGLGQRVGTVVEQGNSSNYRWGVELSIARSFVGLY